MKLVAKLTGAILACGATLLVAQSNNLKQVQHVVIVVQENRTPDNLFNEDLDLISRGAHVQPPSNQGLGNCFPGPGATKIPMSPTDLFTCWDTGHNHSVPAPDWTSMWDKGNMDGACGISVLWQTTQKITRCSSEPSCVSTLTCPYTYVHNKQWNSNPPYGILDPYFNVAKYYGYGNYMFQTNQGPSFPAHQFLLSGSSAPDQINDSKDNICGSNYLCHQWFAAENVHNAANGWGCTSGFNSDIYEIDPSSDDVGGIYNNGYPCYNRPTLVDLLDSAKLSWKYYARSATDLWNAPNAINKICVPSPSTQPGDTCTGQDWVNNVQAVLPNQGKYAGDHAPVLTDIANCNLPAVSWVIPDGVWSDHAGGDTSRAHDGGPSWVAAIVNAIGQDTTCESGKGYWSDTVILVTWDDWGGYYDDVVPPDCKTFPCTGYSNLTGQQYVYGFRVPLMVVGAYAKPAYISGGGVYPPVCQGNTYCHDFGSILNFVEYAFGTGGVPLGGKGGISSNYLYADRLVMDTQPSPPNNYSLYDFFDFTTAHTFTQINGAKYPPSCFHIPLPGNNTCFDGSNYPEDPDDDAIEAD